MIAPKFYFNSRRKKYILNRYVISCHLLVSMFKDQIAELDENLVIKDYLTTAADALLNFQNKNVLHDT